MKKSDTINVPKAIKGKCALMKDKKKAKAYLKLMISALKAEQEFKNRRYTEKDKGAVNE
jgi:hypothetical protein